MMFDSPKSNDANFTVQVFFPDDEKRSVMMQRRRKFADPVTMEQREAEAEANFQAIVENNPALLTILDRPQDEKDFIEWNKTNQSNMMSSPRNIERNTDEAKMRRDAQKDADLRYRILYNFK